MTVLGNSRARVYGHQNGNASVFCRTLNLPAAEIDRDAAVVVKLYELVTDTIRSTRTELADDNRCRRLCECKRRYDGSDTALTNLGKNRGGTCRATNIIAADIEGIGWLKR